MHCKPLVIDYAMYAFVFNKLTSVFHASVLLLIMNFVIVKVAVELSGSADYFDNVMMKFIVNNKTDALKTDISLLLTITNCQIVRSCLLAHRIILTSCVCPLIDNGPFPKKLAPKTSLQGPLCPGGGLPYETDGDARRKF